MTFLLLREDHFIVSNASKIESKMESEKDQ
jgi:hypothetical protein